jgi:hypothetical protein
MQAQTRRVGQFRARPQTLQNLPALRVLRARPPRLQGNKRDFSPRVLQVLRGERMQHQKLLPAVMGDGGDSRRQAGTRGLRTVFVIVA